MSSKHDKQQEWKQYPASCFDASPTYNTWVKITAADLHVLRQEKGFEGERLLEAGDVCDESVDH